MKEKYLVSLLIHEQKFFELLGQNQETSAWQCPKK